MAPAGVGRDGDRGARRRALLRGADLSASADQAGPHAGLPLEPVRAQRRIRAGARRSRAPSVARTDVLVVSVGSTTGWRAAVASSWSRLPGPGPRSSSRPLGPLRGSARWRSPTSSRRGSPARRACAGSPRTIRRRSSTARSRPRSSGRGRGRSRSTRSPPRTGPADTGSGSARSSAGASGARRWCSCGASARSTRSGASTPTSYWRRRRSRAARRWPPRHRCGHVRRGTR